MNKITKKLLVSVLTLAFAVIALGTTTFAWFTIGGNSVVGPISAQVTAGEGVEVSLDGTTYYSVLSSELIEEKLSALIAAELGAGKTFAADFKYMANTSADGKAFLNNAAGSAVAPTFEAGIISLPLYFRTPNEVASKVQLTKPVAKVAVPLSTDKDTYIYSAPITWNADATTSLAQKYTDAAVLTKTADNITSGSSSTFIAANATRISFVEGANVNCVIAPELQGTSHGVAVNGYLGLASQYAAVKGFPIDNTILPMSKNAITDTKVFGDEAPSALTTPNAKLYLGTEAETGYDVVTLTRANPADQYATGNVTVNIWLEGWDPDCINAIFKSTIYVQLNFKVVATA